MQNISKRSFEITFPFCILSSPDSFSSLIFVVVVVIVVLFWFVCLFVFVLFFSVTGHLLGFISVGNVRKHSGNALRILGLDGWKGRWAVEFSGQHCKVFCHFPCLLHWIVLFLIWFERSLPSAQVRWWRCSPWLLKQKGCGSTWAVTGGLRVSRLGRKIMQDTYKVIRWGIHFLKSFSDIYSMIFKLISYII